MTKLPSPVLLPRSHEAMPGQPDPREFAVFYDDQVAIDPAVRLCSLENFGQPTVSGGMHNSVIARLAIPRDSKSAFDHFVIIKSIASDTAKPVFSLRGLQMSYLTGRPMLTTLAPVNLPENKSLIIGRSDHAEQDEQVVVARDLWPEGQYSSFISLKHLTIAVRGDMVLVDESSQNGSKIAAGKYAVAPGELCDKNDKYSAGYTVFARDAALIDGLLKDGELFGGRKFITSKTEIGGDSLHTIDIRTRYSGSEAIVVDPSRSPEVRKEYDKYLNEAIMRIQQGSKDGQPPTRLQVLNAINDTIRANMKYDLNWTEKYSEWLKTQPARTRKANLSVFMKERKGVCRHMGLAAGWLAGELKKQNYIDTPTYVLINEHQDLGGHEAAMNMGNNPDGSDAIVVDPANDYVGPPLAPHWDFRTPEQKAYARERNRNRHARRAPEVYGLIPKLTEMLRKAIEV